MTTLLKLVTLPLWVSGVAAAGLATERTLTFAPGSQESLLLIFALLFAAHAAWAGLLRIETPAQRRTNTIALGALGGAAIGGVLGAADAEQGALVFWSTAPLLTALAFARLAAPATVAADDANSRRRP